MMVADGSGHKILVTNTMVGIPGYTKWRGNLLMGKFLVG